MHNPLKRHADPAWPLTLDDIAPRAPRFEDDFIGWPRLHQAAPTDVAGMAAELDRLDPNAGRMIGAIADDLRRRRLRRETDELAARQHVHEDLVWTAEPGSPFARVVRRRLRCHTCDLLFDDPARFSSHLRGPCRQVISCPVCDAKFRLNQRDRFDAHVAQCRAAREAALAAFEEDDNEDLWPVVASPPEPTTDLEDIAVEAEDAGYGADDDATPRPHRCAWCERAFRRPCELGAHRRSHRRYA